MGLCDLAARSFRSTNNAARTMARRHIMDVKVGRTASLRSRVAGANRASCAAAFAVVLAIGPSAPSFAAGDAGHGAKVYHDCMLCHSLDKNGIGPSHRDVFGRRAGSVPNYAYSAALKGSNVVWNETTLDQWLTNPQALVPGTKMMFSVGSAQDRADVIAFLKEKAATDPPSATPGAN
jgi:cytochrome c